MLLPPCMYNTYSCTGSVREQIAIIMAPCGSMVNCGTFIYSGVSVMRVKSSCLAISNVYTTRVLEEYIPRRFNAVLGFALLGFLV